MDWSAYYYSRGLEMEMARAYDRAVVRFKQAIEAGLVNSEVYRRLGICLSEVESYSEAIRAIRKAIEIDPNYVILYAELAFIYRKLGMRREAEREYKRALDLAPDIIDFYLPIIEIYQQQKRWDEALELEERAIKVDKTDARLHWLRGVSYLQQGRLLECEHSWKNAQEMTTKEDLKRVYQTELTRLQQSIAPSTIEQRDAAMAALSSLPRRTGRSGELESAVSRLEAVCLLDPFFVPGRLQLAEAYLDAGKIGDAIEAYKSIVHQQPEHQIALFGWGTALTKMGEFTAAIEVFRKANEIDSLSDQGRLARKELALLDVRSRYGLAPVLKFETAMSKYESQRADPNEAINLMQEAVALAPEIGLFHYELGWLCLLSEPRRLSMAVRHFRLAVELDPNEGRYWGGLGMAFVFGEQFRDAVPMLMRAIHLDPNEPEARNGLATCYVASHQVDLAVGELRWVTELDPDRLDGWRNLYNLLIEQRNFGEASAELQRLLQTVPDAPFAEWAEKALSSLLELRDDMLKDEQRMPAVPEAAQARLSETAQRLCQEGRELEIAGFQATAIERYQAAVSEGFDAYDPHFLLGNAYARAGKHQDAIREYTYAASAKATEQETADAYYNLGNSCWELEDLERAIASFRKAVEVYPDVHDAREKLGLCLADQGNYDDAIQAVKAEIELQRNAGTFTAGPLNFVLGQIYLQAGKSMSALFEFRKGMTAGPDLASIHELTGRILGSEGYWNLAESEFEQALELDPADGLARSLIEATRFIEYEYPWMSRADDARVKHSFEHRSRRSGSFDTSIAEGMSNLRNGKGGSKRSATTSSLEPRFP